VCWWRRKQTSPRGAGAAALGALAILHSLPALQQWHYCTQNRYRQQQGRRCCIPAQCRRPAMTPPRPANRKRASSSRRRRRMPLNTAPTRLERFETWSNNAPQVGRLQVVAAAAGADKDATARVHVDDKSKQQEAAAVLNMSSPRPCPPPRNPQQRSCFLLLKLSGAATAEQYANAVRPAAHTAGV